MKKKTSIFNNSLIWFGAGVSIAEILTGTYLAPLGFGKGILAILVGHVIGCILLAALSIQIVCAIINVWWKVSTHSAAIGGVAGALIAFSFKFAFNPVWWLCLVLILGGMVGTARIILRQHTLSQVVTGYLIGFLCAFNMIIRF